MRAGPGIILGLTVAAVLCPAGEVPFHDDFNGKLAEGWSWVRELREAWRVSAKGLEVRVLPGNMWGPANDARNVLVRPVPDPGSGPLEISVSVENHPTEQYEQVDLVWYYSDSHMVKIGQERVDGKLSIVMGREEGDKTRTIAIIPLDSNSVRLRFRVSDKTIRGQFLPAGSDRWRDAGECDLPAPSGQAPQISLQFYQGPAQAEHWARVNDFRVERVAP
jgi:regulation of enolase protein 1 (concanavalin A-like superfamily)